MAQAIPPVLRGLSGRKVWLQRSFTVLGLDPRYRNLLTRIHSRVNPDNPPSVDAHDIEHSDIWDGSPSGLGGWGSKTNDFQIYDGGFKDEIRFYPTPHHIRRNFSLFPFTNEVFTQLAAGTDFAFPLDFMPNTTMTAENVAFMVNGFDGDYFGFQAYFEGLPVSYIASCSTANSA